MIEAEYLINYYRKISKKYIAGDSLYNYDMPVMKKLRFIRILNIYLYTFGYIL